jgi:2-dehydro-3-deoxygluconokinase
MNVNTSFNKIIASFWDGKELLHSQKFNTSNIINRIGAGDAFITISIYELLSLSDDNQTVLEFAAATTCLKYSISGVINLATVNKIKVLMGVGRQMSIEIT